MLPEDYEIPSGFVNYSDVLDGYYLLADYFYTIDHEDKFLFGLKSPSLLSSALSRQYVSFGVTSKWKTIFEIASTLFFGLVKNHAFHDGNKRISLLMLLYYLHENGRVVNCSHKEFQDLTVRTAANDLYNYGKPYRKFAKKPDSDILFIANFIKRKTRKIDKRYYPVIYREFDTLLREHGCRLDNPSGGFIDLVYNEQVEKWHGFKTKIVERRFRIGFNGWTKQIGPKAVKEGLKAANLISKCGVDSNVFFKGGEPLSALINEFEAPLRRLKDR
jgi:death-on-curing family protein